MNRSTLIKELKSKIDTQEDEDYWQEIIVNSIYYDCNIYERAMWEDDYHKDNDPNNLKVCVYGVKPDKVNPGFMTTDTSKELFTFYMPSDSLPTVKTLVIENVDYKQLDKQRLILAEFLMSKHRLSKKRVDALNGILNMLDFWSDKEYFKYKEV